MTTLSMLGAEHAQTKGSVYARSKAHSGLSLCLFQGQGVHQPKALSVLVAECALSVLGQGPRQARVLSWQGV